MRPATSGPRGGERNTTAAPMQVALVVALAGVLAACPGEPPPLGGTTTEDTSTGSSSSSSSAVPDSSGGSTQTPACADYLACLADVEPDQVPDAEAEFGPEGSCWSDPATAAACDATCLDELQARCPAGTGGGTGEELLTCSIEALAPGLDSPVVVGDGAEVLPPSIGALLERNCGCHYVAPEMLDPDVPAYFGAMPMATWQDFHSTFMGTLVHERVRQRAAVELSMPPPFFCDPLDFGSLSAEDHALLGAWLEASAPDAATWGSG